MRAKRSATVTRLDEDSHTDDLRDTVTEAVDKIISFGEYVAKLSPVQRRIASLRDCGYGQYQSNGYGGYTGPDAGAVPGGFAPDF